MKRVPVPVSVGVSEAFPGVSERPLPKPRGECIPFPSYPASRGMRECGMDRPRLTVEPAAAAAAVSRPFMYTDRGAAKATGSGERAAARCLCANAPAETDLRRR